MLIFTDIDDTLIQTKRKIKDSSSFNNIGSFDTNNEPSSFIDNSRLDFINSILLKNECIPVTARNIESIKRVNIPFNSFKVLNFGGTILNKDNSLNLEWHNKMILEQSNNNILDKLNILDSTEILPSNNYKLIKFFEDDLFVYYNFRNTDLNIDNNILFKNKLEEYLKKENIDNFYIYLTDRDVTLIPKYIKKNIAVEYLINLIKPELSLGIGDHLNDFNFMSLCDFSIFPNDSSLSKLLKGY